jgi:hypothetical protein
VLTYNLKTHFNILHNLNGANKSSGSRTQDTKQPQLIKQVHE